MNETISIFFAADDNFVKYTMVAIASLKANANPRRRYHIRILQTHVSDVYRHAFTHLQDKNFKIEFVDVTEYMEKYGSAFHVRDYYTKTTYFRLFIAQMFPHLKKAIYLDSDMVVLGDIAELYDCDLGDNYVAACPEQAMAQTEVYGHYVEAVMGIDRNEYFNAGMLVINCELFRRDNLLGKFLDLLGKYTFVVTQDEDYLNVLCEGRVLWLSPAWNTEVYGELPVAEEEIKIIHYIMVAKPWHFHDCRLKEYFWKYAEQTPMVDKIHAELAAYTDLERAQDLASCDRLAALAEKEAAREDSYFRIMHPGLDPERVKIKKKIERFEKEARFDEDVEDDPPTRQIKPGEVDFERKTPAARLGARMAFAAARKFVDQLIKDGKLRIAGYPGIEHFQNLKSGAVVTCNHFNAYDSFAMHLSYDESKQKKRRFFRVIREGNYTNFPGFYGLLMRNCNTLPLSSNPKVMSEFVHATCNLLRDGNFVLFYPEQSMWWNYRKPKPLKSGAFRLAARNHVPVLPCFITMEDSDDIGEDGYPIQIYTVHVSEPIYPDPEKTITENTEMMMKENYRVWKEIYEKTYGVPLTYTCPKEKLEALL